MFVVERYDWRSLAMLNLTINGDYFDALQYRFIINGVILPPALCSSLNPCFLPLNVTGINGGTNAVFGTVYTIKVTWLEIMTAPYGLPSTSVPQPPIWFSARAGFVGIPFACGHTYDVFDQCPLPPILSFFNPNYPWGTFAIYLIAVFCGLGLPVTYGLYLLSFKVFPETSES
jgi:hypothetical protein